MGIQPPQLLKAVNLYELSVSNCRRRHRTETLTPRRLSHFPVNSTLPFAVSSDFSAIISFLTVCILNKSVAVRNREH